MAATIRCASRLPGQTNLRATRHHGRKRPRSRRFPPLHYLLVPPIFILRCVRAGGHAGLISLVGIYLALLIQFNNAVKPLLVFAAAPYGAIGALIALAIMGTPFGFMAFLGVASLIGVIVSHVIVLFDFIEEMHEKGEPLERALPDAGIERIRPVMITVGATILALFPLALEGGPLWKPLCYAQIGGLAVATFITLLLVPVFYSIFVLDLKWIKWETTDKRQEITEEQPTTS